MKSTLLLLVVLSATPARESPRPPLVLQPCATPTVIPGLSLVTYQGTRVSELPAGATIYEVEIDANNVVIRLDLGDEREPREE